MRKNTIIHGTLTITYRLLSLIKFKISVSRELGREKKRKKTRNIAVSIIDNLFFPNFFPGKKRKSKNSRKSEF